MRDDQPDAVMATSRTAQLSDEALPFWLKALKQNPAQSTSGRGEGGAFALRPGRPRMIALAAEALKRRPGPARGRRGGVKSGGRPCGLGSAAPPMTPR